MTASTLLVELRGRGVKLAVNAGRLVVDAPRHAYDDETRVALIRLKPEIIARLTTGDSREGRLNPAPAFLADRWGPSLEHDDPPVVFPAPATPRTPPDYRTIVAAWPAARWSRWRRHVTDALAALEGPADVEDIRAAERHAFHVIRAEVDPPTDASPTRDPLRTAP